MSAAQSRPQDRGEAPALAVAVVARRLGVAPATLRTWDRRYGLGPTVHVAGSHRRYTADDVARLVVMRRLTLGGVAPADAARSALAGESVPAAVPAAVPATAAVLAGPVITSPTMLVPTMLIDAALHQDGPACRRLLAAMLADVVPWWTDLVEPARASLAERTVLARAGEYPEWVLDSAALAVLRDRTAPARDLLAIGQRLVLLLGAPHERRPIVLHALACALTDRGVDARVVTGPMEPRRVLELVTMAHPRVVALLSELPAPDLSVVADLHAADPELPLVVGLTEWLPAPALPEGRSVHRVHTLPGVLNEVLAATG
ncbi:MerR family transcriptional regulator [Pengzhenrongella frigida]|uniref:MerR family transcriptional regulator n=1 Tax=Pengzhenrongella frigida TaxID=1259133 RepID=A0A4Q5N227_9MICO|nr:MerR family transcriptional regulator [Cellulomonas sp. HLT2-17]RYV52180.1 MerR family transcriptional regulator [Cellulomonas sp. HLT2-17]